MIQKPIHTDFATTPRQSSRKREADMLTESDVYVTAIVAFVILVAWLYAWSRRLT
jgi:hypothetical protein